MVGNSPPPYFQVISGRLKGIGVALSLASGKEEIVNSWYPGEGGGAGGGATAEIIVDQAFDK